MLSSERGTASTSSDSAGSAAETGAGGRKERLAFSVAKSRRLCKFYARGHCKFGDRCRNMHAADGIAKDTAAALAKPG